MQVFKCMQVFKIAYLKLRLDSLCIFPTSSCIISEFEIKRGTLKVAPYSFMTARELVAILAGN